jgi:superfamily II DNA or RNA helicase
MTLYLQNILNALPFESLPLKWQSSDFERFSNEKSLFDFQQHALQNAAKGLWLYFLNKNAGKEEMYQHYRFNGLSDNLDYNLSRKSESKTAKYLLEYPDDYPVTDNKISFARFINRMSFWMATGSGKTLVIVKLVEMLGKLISSGEIPAHDILFLTHREDLIDQFRIHVDEYNGFNHETRINIRSLKEYEAVKRDNVLPFSRKEITIFYYRSDLISDEHKEKIVNFRNYDNEGKWYILLDEAHKGDREESKRQVFYSILSRNGFLFNFSATFTDPRDFATCAFNFNLSKYVEEGYGKHIFVSSSGTGAFRTASEFSMAEKQRIVLKTLLLQAYVNIHFERIRSSDDSLYHRPLLLTLVNSVDVEESDLELFFRELEKIAGNDIKAHLLEEAKNELKLEYDKNSKYVFEERLCIIDHDLIDRLTYSDILKHVMNSETPGRIEVLKIPGNRNELIFRLMTSPRPFALIKIGDISGWLKEKLEGYEINESFENESYFRRLNSDDSEINILMGSRSFYEGWDSNRPNLILFINIGVGSDAKKFVLQSVGRGVRIEPQRNRRKRLQELYNAGIVSPELFRKVNQHILPLESLYVYGTNASNLNEIIRTLKEEKQDKNLGENFIINPDTDRHILLIPVYKNSERIFAEERDPQKFSISSDDLALSARFLNFTGDKTALARFEPEVKVLKKTREAFSEINRYFDTTETRTLYDPEMVLERIFDYLGIKSRDLDSFKAIENEIVHFRNIRFSGKEAEGITEEIQKVRRFPEKEEKLEQLKLEFSETKDIDKYTSAVQNLEKDYIKEAEYQYDSGKVKIKYLANHYYYPVIVSESEKVDYLNHIIDVESERKFIDQLEKNISGPDNIFSGFDWWLFSKLDQSVDQVYIPYYNPKENNISKYNPDFIFWAQKGSKYLILFVDPKGTTFASYQHKVDGFNRLFEGKNFNHNDLQVSVKLQLFTGSLASVGEGYRSYWFDSFEGLAEKIKKF